MLLRSAVLSLLVYGVLATCVRADLIVGIQDLVVSPTTTDVQVEVYLSSDASNPLDDAFSEYFLSFLVEPIDAGPGTLLQFADEPDQDDSYIGDSSYIFNPDGSPVGFIVDTTGAYPNDVLEVDGYQTNGDDVFPTSEKFLLAVVSLEYFVPPGVTARATYEISLVDYEFLRADFTDVPVGEPIDPGEVNFVPEPGTWGMSIVFGSLLAGIGWWRYGRGRNAAGRRNR